jgi:hypothetical protein
MKKARKLEHAQRMRSYWARMKVEEPEKYAEKVAALKRVNKNLSGKQMRSVGMTTVNNAKQAHEEKKDWEEPRSPAQIAYVSEIPPNPRMVFARNDVCERFEVLVGRNSVLWVDCPMEIKPSLDYPGYYEFVGELPHGRWDRSYALRFERN